MRHHILCPVDFSKLSALGLKYAATMAQCSGARITVLFANSYSPPPYFTQARVAEFEAQFRESMREAEAYLRQFVESTLGEIPSGADLRVVESLPVDAIRKATKETGAGLVVMGTHGRSGVNRLMLGSVAEKVLRESSVPVLTVRGDTSLPPTIRNILCPVNQSSAAQKALALSAELASCVGATVTVLHVREPGAEDTITDLCAWIPESQRAHCAIREMTGEGEPPLEIVRLASELHADLLVMGARHRVFFDTTVIGTTTARVVRHSACPVLTVIEKQAGAQKSTTEESTRHAV